MREKLSLKYLSSLRVSQSKGERSDWWLVHWECHGGSPGQIIGLSQSVQALMLH